MRILLLSITLVVTLAFAACSDNNDDPSDDTTTDSQDSDVQEQLEVIRQRLDFHDETVSQAKVIIAMNTFRVEGLHEIDDAMQSASAIEAGWSGSTERMLQAAQSVDWPADLQDRAHALEDTLDALMDALDAGDLATAKGLATDAHTQWHDLEHDAYHFAAGPQPDHGHDHPHEDESATPAATAS
jgi:hypothetical protein